MKYDKQNLILFVLILIFSFTFILGTVFKGEGKSKSEKVKTALVSGSLIDSVSDFEIQSGEEILEFRAEKSGGAFGTPVWFCGYYTENGSYFIPAKQEKIKNLFDELSRIRTLEKISVKNKQAESFGLGDDFAFILRYVTSESSNEIRFGDSNFSDTGRYLKGSGENVVYLTDKSFNSFLFAGLNQWNDPYLVSRNLGIDYKDSDFVNLKNKEILELRHGGISFYIPSESDKAVKTLFLEMGDTGAYTLSFYKIPDENNYHVKVEYSNPLKNGSKKFEYAVKISEWTYNKL